MGTMYLRRNTVKETKTNKTYANPIAINAMTTAKTVSAIQILLRGCTNGRNADNHAIMKRIVDNAKISLALR